MRQRDAFVRDRCKAETREHDFLPSHVSGFSYAMRAVCGRETDQAFHDAMCDLFLKFYRLRDVGQWVGTVRS
jgi:hypothetical protein